jgi:hypothetical protein
VHARVRLAQRSLEPIDSLRVERGRALEAEGLGARVGELVDDALETFSPLIFGMWLFLFLVLVMACARYGFRRRRVAKDTNTYHSYGGGAGQGPGAGALAVAYRPARRSKAGSITVRDRREVAHHDE